MHRFFVLNILSIGAVVGISYSSNSVNSSSDAPNDILGAVLVMIHFAYSRIDS